jgi:hypothetical protein
MCYMKAELGISARSALGVALLKDGEVRSEGIGTKSAHPHCPARTAHISTFFH